EQLTPGFQEGRQVAQEFRVITDMFDRFKANNLIERPQAVGSLIQISEVQSDKSDTPYLQKPRPDASPLIGALIEGGPQRFVADLRGIHRKGTVPAAGVKSPERSR